MDVEQPRLPIDMIASTHPASSRSSMTLCEMESTTLVTSGSQFGKKKQRKKANQQHHQQSQQPKRQKPTSKVEKPFYQLLGDELLKSTRLHLEPRPEPLPEMPPMSTNFSLVPTPMSEKMEYFPSPELDLQAALKRSLTSPSPSQGRKSIESNLSGVTKIICDEEDPTVKYRVRGAIYTLEEFMSMPMSEDVILRYGRVAHMGVRDHSYKFWMNSTRTAVVHFKILNKVAVLGGDPICHPARVALTLEEFEHYCRKVGWKVAIIGASTDMVTLAQQKGWTCMNFGTEQVLNPQKNEVLLGKSGKRTVTQCRQLIDPARGGTTVHTYSPIHGRDHVLETSLRNIYDEWRNERNTSRDNQAFVTVFDLFAMPNLMTFLYTTSNTGTINGFAALRKLGATDGYHIDPFIQSSSAPRGVSDLLIFASLALLNAKGCSYLALGYEPSTEPFEIWGLPKMLHKTTRKLYKHVFGKLSVGGKEAFHARWKPDETQSAPLYLIFVGKIPSPRYMLAMTHFANISVRQILASDWQAIGKKKEKKDGTTSTVDGVDDVEGEGLVFTKPKSQAPVQQKCKTAIPVVKVTRMAISA